MNNIFQQEACVNNSSTASTTGASPVVFTGSVPSVFSNDEFGSVRVIMREDNVPLFCLKDVATCLGYADQAQAVRDRCDADSVVEITTETSKGPREAKFGPESEVYRLIFGSKLESAKKFQDWVFKEILPSIRKTGSYSVQKQPSFNLPPTYAEALRELADVIEEKEKLLSENSMQAYKIKTDAPKVAAYDVFMGVSDDLITIGDFAKILHTKWSDIKPHSLFSILREAKILKDSYFDKNIPYQKYIDRGYFKVKETTSTNSIGYSYISRQTLITPKGQKYLLDKFLTARASDPEEQMTLFEGEE